MCAGMMNEYIMPDDSRCRGFTAENVEVAENTAEGEYPRIAQMTQIKK